MQKTIEPIISEQVSEELRLTITRAKEKEKLQAWGFDSTDGSAILLVGPPGTGKTTIGNWLGSKLKMETRHFTIADIGSNVPGENERNIRKFFLNCRRAAGKPILIFIDECESLLLDRTSAGVHEPWRIGVIDELLQQITNYPNLIVLATNRPEMLDGAAMRRMFAIITVPPPDQALRERLWVAKIPPTFPLKCDAEQICNLAKFEMTGSDIVRTLNRYASYCLEQKFQDSEINYNTLLKFIKEHGITTPAKS